MKKYRLWSALLICVLFSLLFFGCSSKKIDLMSFAAVEFSGLDGKGKARLDVDWGEFEKAVLSEKERDSLAAFAKVLELEGSVQYSVNKTDGLSNGDEVVISAEWDKETAKKYKVNFAAKEKKVTVSGLLVPTEIDLFGEVSIEYEGVAPFARAIVRNASSDAFLKTVNYTIDNPSNLSNGDQIKVTAAYNESVAEANGYLAVHTEKTYVVEGIDEYIASYDKIDKGTLAKMDKQARDVIESKLADKFQYTSYLYPGSVSAWKASFDSVSISNVELKNAYFFVLKKGMDKGYGDVSNSVFLIYEVQFSTNISPAEGDVVYLPVYYKDIVLRDNGAIDVVITDAFITNAKSDTFDNLYRDVVTANKAKYDYEEIEFPA